MGICVSDIFMIRVNSGRNTLFWLDDRTCDGSFANRIPSIFNLDSKKSFISDRISSNKNFIWEWKKNPSNSMEFLELNALFGALSHVDLVSGVDKWR